AFRVVKQKIERERPGADIPPWIYAVGRKIRVQIFRASGIRHVQLWNKHPADKSSEPRSVMGASVDADSDRFGNVDSNGIFMSANDMIALIAYFLKKEIGLDGSIGKTVATSNFVNAIAEFLNVDLDEEKVGFKEFVNNTITKGKDYLVAGEESSHVAIGPFMRSWDDGIVVGLMGLWIMAKTGKSLTEYKDMIQKTLDKKFMITTLTRRSQIVKDIIINKVAQTNQEIANILKGEERALTEVELESLSLVQELEKMQPQKVKAINTKDGVKLVLASGDWVLIRPSGTEPAGKAYVEVAGNYAASETDMQKKFSELSSIVDQMIGYSGDNAMVSQQIDDEYDEGNVLSLYQEQSDYAMVGDLKDKAYQSANIFKQDYPQIYNLLTGRIEGLYWELLNPLKVKSVRQELQMFADGKLTEAITRNINRLQEIQEKENKKSLESPSDIWARASREKGLWQQADNLLLTVLRSKTSDLAMVAEIKEAYNAINPLKNKNIAVYNLMHDRIEFLELNYLNYQKRQGFIRELEMFSQGKLSEAIEINIQRLESLGDQEAKALWIQAKEAIEKNEKDNALITEIPVFSSIKDFYSPGEGKAIINQKNYYLNLFNLDFGTKIYRLNLFYGDFDDKGEIGTQIALYDSYDRPLARLKVFGENLLTLNWRDAFQKLADEGKIRFSDESNELTQKRYRELNEAVREMNLNNQQIIQAKIDLENPEFKPEDKDLIKTRIEILLRVAQGYIYSGNLESSYRILVESKELLSKISGLTSEEKKDLEFNLKKGTFYYNQAVDSSQDENLFKIQDSSVGGIDLNPEFLDMQIKRDGKGVPLPLNLQPLETLKIEGFIPVIINITPVENFPMLLGVNEKDTNEKKISFVQPELNPVEPLDRKILKA
ncbi:MAG TPA: hypothetical protein PLH56_01100, partial [Candidatus Omnitrophota bacterium]|nr:hypothetical protein [Candidatus Omnitrophota bacterium]